MTYTLNELVASTSLSRRTIYYYIGRGLLPQAGRGRGARYSETHLWRLLLIRALTDLGVPLDLIQRHVGGLSLERVKLLVAPLLPLDDLNSQLQEEMQGIRKSLEPSTDLDIGNMGLEDPMALRHRLSALEDHAVRIESEQTKARETLYRILVAEEASEDQSLAQTPAELGEEVASLSQLGDIVSRLERICSLLEAAVLCNGNHSEGESSPPIDGARTPSVVLVPGIEYHGDGGSDTDRALDDLRHRIARTVAQWEIESRRNMVS